MISRFAATPGSGGRPNEAARQFAACMASQGNRVVLSGIGGDEVMGGVPTPVPELAGSAGRWAGSNARSSTESLGTQQKKALVPSVFRGGTRILPSRFARNVRNTSGRRLGSIQALSNATTLPCRGTTAGSSSSALYQAFRETSPRWKYCEDNWLRTANRTRLTKSAIRISTGICWSSCTPSRGNNLFAPAIAAH